MSSAGLKVGIMTACLGIFVVCVLLVFFASTIWKIFGALIGAGSLLSLRAIWSEG